ncbi:MAG TPA: hypothetical protein VFF73_01480 [Planctomycetota bacterium]|nr:hypothetical protein [Planctomycetota bacterium]
MLAAALDRASSRMSLGQRLARAGWAAVLAAIAAELGFVAERGLAHAREAGLVIGALLLLAAFILLIIGRKPTAREAARRIDRSLGQGALVETAAEALEGRHGGFAQVLARDVEARLAGQDLGALVPLQVPRVLGVGAGAALLLLAIALGPVTETPRDEAAPATSFETSEDAPSPGAETKIVKNPVTGRPRPTSKPGAADLARDLHDLAAKLVKITKPDSPDEARHRQDLERAVEKGDLAAAREAMNGLARAGGQASAKAVAKAADTIGGRARQDVASQGGAGSGNTKPVATSDVLPNQVGPDREDPGKPAQDRTPWRVLEAERRYRAAIE